MTEQISPTTASPVVTPQAEATPAAAVVVASATPSVPEQAAVPVTETPAPAEVKKDTEASSLLDTADKSKTDTLVEVKADVKTDATNTEVKKEEGGQSAEAAQLPTFEDFKLPDGFTHDKEKLSEFVKDLGDLGFKTKAEQKVMQEFGQKMMDKYVAEMQTVIKQVQDQSVASQKAKIDGWKSETEKLADKDTVLASAGKSLSYLPDALKQDFKKFYNETGIGNNAILLRTLAHYDQIISDFKSKYESEDGVKPLTATVPIEKPKGMAAKMYGGMK